VACLLFEHSISSYRRKFGLDLNVDNAIVCSDEMKQLYAHLTEIAWLVNDIFSWNIEEVQFTLWISDLLLMRR
jgi:hypothetical protein